MNIPEGTVTKRPMEEGDKNYIFSTWLQGLKHGNDEFKFMEPKSYFRTYQKVVEDILNNPKVNATIVCLEDDPDVIVAFCVSEGSKVHWIFTRPVWRNFKIAKSLLPKDFDKVSHITTVGKAILLTKYPLVQYDPF